MKNKPKALYIHIPFCHSICDYCDFTKLQYFSFMAEKYLDSLFKEIDSFNINHPLDTIYIGGGTPTALEDDLFENLLKKIYPLAKGVKEYTVECNPESLSEVKLQLMKKYGVNRLSIGVESTDDKILKAINRQHTFNDVIKAVEAAKKVGFDNINIDLIIGLPHVSKSLFEKDLENILKLDVQHISCYSLTVHEHTRFFLNNISEPDDDFARDLYDLTEKILSSNGFIHYEISNWAKTGYESKHNYTYWKNEQYYGVGLGASGFLDHLRYTNTRNLDKYNSGEYVDEKEYVDWQNDEHYFLMLNLRTVEGIDLREYERLYGQNFLNKYKSLLNKYFSCGWLIYEEERQKIYPSHDGMMTLDTILVDLFAE